MNGEGQVHIDRGQWRYRFSLDTDSIAIYRSQRTGQGLVPPEAWRSLAALGVSDAFVVAVPGGWQPFVEVDDGRQRWVLQRRPTYAEAQATTSHFLASLADAVAHIPSQLAVDKSGDKSGEKFVEKPGEKHGEKPGDMESEMRAAEALGPVAVPAEEQAAEAAFAQACKERESAGWELIYSRQRSPR